jgi:hypothetical protein
MVVWNARTAACSLDWSMPQHHFDNVHDDGWVSYWEHVFSINLHSGGSLPVFLNFRSDRDALSPYVGYGWMIPLLESRFIQTSENGFEMIQPDGWIRPFGRRNSRENILTGVGGWKAEVKGDLLIAAAECGWRMTFRNGRLVSFIGPSIPEVTYIFEHNKVAEIRQAGYCLLKIVYDSQSNLISKLETPSSTLSLDYALKPRFGSSAHYLGVDRSLSLISEAGLKRFVFEYGPSPSEKDSPYINVKAFRGQDYTFTWNRETKFVEQAGPYLYSITMTPVRREIHRRHRDGSSDSWIRAGNGTEICSQNGVTRTIEREPRGGAIRSIKEKRGAEEKIIYHAIFDEGLNRLQENRDGTSIVYQNGISVISKNGINYTLSPTK